MIMTFHGRNRSGEAEQKHLHEVAPVMWVPLVVLAALSVVGGWLNVPEAIAQAPLLGWLPSSEWAHEWLHPVMESADAVAAAHLPAFLHHAPVGGGEVLWAVLSFGIAVAVIALAFAVLGRKAYKPAKESEAPRGFARVLLNKYYVDEFYDAVIVRPVVAVSRAFWRFIDQGIIDGLANGAGYASRAFGWVGSRVQTGQVNTYAFAVLAGALFLIALVML
jgi:NADH-quinone oxidoreductase subunit L